MTHILESTILEITMGIVGMPCQIYQWYKAATNEAKSNVTSSERRVHRKIFKG